MNRLEPNERKRSILHAAVSAARAHGWFTMTREHVAQTAGVSVGLVSRYLGTMPKVRQHVMREAIRLEHVDIIAQGLILNDAVALKAPDALRRAAGRLVGK